MLPPRCARLALAGTPVALCVAFLAIASLTAPRADCIHYADYVRPLDVHTFEAFTRAMDYSAPHLYVVDDEGTLTAFDAADPCDLRQIGSLVLPADLRDIAVHGPVGHVVFVTSDELQLIDLSDSAQPAALGSVTIPASPMRVAVTDGYAYVPSWDYGEDNHGVYVVDVADPWAPQVVNRVELDQYPSNVIIAEPYAYALDYRALWVLDISEPSAPIPRGSVVIPGDAVHLCVRGDYVYVVCDAAEFPAPNNGFYMVNVSDPNAPWIEGSLQGEDAPHLGVGLWEHYAIVGRYGAGFTFIDLSDPEHLVESGQVGVQCCPSEYIVDGATLFALSHTLASYELHAPFTPDPVAVIPDTEGSQYVETRGTLAYTARDYGHDFCVYDLADPADPVLLGHEPLALDHGGVLAITEDVGRRRYAYVGDAVSQEGMHILDISDPRAPIEVGFLALEDGPSDLAVAGSILYVMAGYLGLMSFDITDPANPEYLSNLTFGFSAQMMYVHGTMVYVGRRVLHHPGLFIVDASDPGALEIVSESTEPQRPCDFLLDGERLYVADGDYGLLVMDVADPEHPAAISRMCSMRRAYALARDADLLYVADQNDRSGVQVIDVSDPAEPFPIGYYPATLPNDLALINGHLLIATFHEPLEVAPLECASARVDRDDAAGEDLRLPHLTLGVNPGLGMADLRLDLPRQGEVLLTVHDTQGRRLSTLYRGCLDAGRHGFHWNGCGAEGHAVPAGIYFVRAVAGPAALSRRVVLVR